MPTSDPYWRVKELFVEALDKRPGEEREAFVRGACGDDAALVLRINEMLGAHARASAVLPPASEAPAVGLAATEYSDTLAAAAASERAGEMIGPYKLLERIGEGGMGAVWMAEQREPIRRTVALKLIKLGMDTRSVIARFEAERQALAMMDHPNIARVFDAGSTGAGRPYFAMELVKGVPITQYCDEHHLVVRQRLDLFVQVCGAVQHAHQKGVIHRDIKPSNVLVATHEDRPLAKVIDFGIAKATQARLTEKTLFTDFRQFIGTPEYMSPEQALGDLDIDTRSDVYALGVLLYELLVGATPFDGRELRSKAYAEMQRIIREVEPPRPSTRLPLLGTLPAVAARRGTEPARLSASVRGELDWIVMKCLEKDRARRYATAIGLGADVQRYLADEPVAAAAPSRAYRLRKFVRRNRTAVIVSLAMVLLLLGGVIGTTLGLVGQSRQRIIAEQQSAVAQAVSRFQTNMLLSADPIVLGDTVTVLQAVMAAAQELDSGRLGDQPLVEAGVRLAIGDTLRALDRLDDAQPNLRRALELRRKYLPAAHPDVAECLSVQGVLLMQQGRLSEAEAMLREALEMYRGATPAQPQYISLVMTTLGQLLHTMGRLDESESVLRTGLDLRRRTLRSGNPDIAESLRHLADVLSEQGRHRDAEPLIREAMQIYRTSYPPGHPRISYGTKTLARLLRLDGRREEAERLLSGMLEDLRNAFPAGHGTIADGLQQLAIVMAEQGKLDRSEALFREALAMRRQLLPARHRLIGQVLGDLAAVLYSRGKTAEAAQLAREALDVAREAYGPGNAKVAASAHNLGRMLQAEGSLDEAEPLLRESLKIARQAYPRGHPDTARSVNALAHLLVQRGNPAEAEPLLRESIEDLQRADGADHWRVAISRVRLGDVLTALQRWPEAESELLQSELVLAATPQAPPGRHRECVSALVDLYIRWDQSQPGRGYDAKAAQWRAKLPATRPAGTSPSIAPATNDAAPR